MLRNFPRDHGNLLGAAGAALMLAFGVLVYGERGLKRGSLEAESWIMENCISQQWRSQGLHVVRSEGETFPENQGPSRVFAD